MPPMRCPSCAEKIPSRSRFCRHCGIALDSGETLEMLPGRPSPETRELLAAQPVEFHETVHETLRRPFGLAPTELLGGVAAIALVVAVVLLATAAWIPGIIALAVVIGSGTLFASAVAHDPGSRAAIIATRVRRRAPSAARFAALRARTWTVATIELLRIRQRRHRLKRELRDQLGPLGEAVYREDRERADALKAQAGELEQALQSADAQAAAVASAARARIDQERATVQPTQVLRVAATESDTLDVDREKGSPHSSGEPL